MNIMFPLSTPKGPTEKLARELGASGTMKRSVILDSIIHCILHLL